MLRSRVEPSPKGPNRRVYSLTGEGRTELLGWLRGGPVVGTERFAYLAQLYFMDAIGNLHETRAFMAGLRDHFGRWLAQLWAVEREVIATYGDASERYSDAGFHQFAALRMGIHSIGAKVTWCNETLAAIDRRLSVQARRRGLCARGTAGPPGAFSMTIASLLFELLIWAHVATGFVGLAAFWVPVFARKGGRTHVQAGRIYTYCAYVVTVSAVTASAGRIVSYQFQGAGIAERPDLYGFAVLLGYLGVVTFATVRQAMRVVATGRRPRRCEPRPRGARLGVHRRQHRRRRRRPPGVVRRLADLVGNEPIGLFIGRGMLRLMHNPRAQHMGWVLQPPGLDARRRHRLPHGVHRLRAQRVWAYEIAGPFAVVPWLLPTVVGIPAIVVWTRYYRRKFTRRPPPRQLERRVAPTPVACRLPRLPIDDGDPGGRPGILHEAIAASGVERLRHVRTGSPARAIDRRTPATPWRCRTVARPTSCRAAIRLSGGSLPPSRRSPHSEPRRCRATGRASARACGGHGRSDRRPGCRASARCA